MNTIAPSGPTPGAGCPRRPSTTSSPRRSWSSGGGSTTCPSLQLPWLLTVARNVVGTERRGAARRQRLWVKAQSGHVEGSDPSEPGIGDGRVLVALARLNERDREALTLVAWDGLTPAQAAAVLGEPSVRFRQRLHRAGRRLRTQLAAERFPEKPASPRHDRAATGGPS